MKLLTLLAWPSALGRLRSSFVLLQTQQHLRPASLSTEPSYKESQPIQIPGEHSLILLMGQKEIVARITEAS